MQMYELRYDQTVECCTKYSQVYRNRGNDQFGMTSERSENIQLPSKSSRKFRTSSWGQCIRNIRQSYRSCTFERAEIYWRQYMDGGGGYHVSWQGYPVGAEHRPKFGSPSSVYKDVRLCMSELFSNGLKTKYNRSTLHICQRKSTWKRWRLGVFDVKWTLF